MFKTISFLSTLSPSFVDVTSLLTEIFGTKFDTTFDTLTLLKSICIVWLRYSPPFNLKSLLTIEGNKIFNFTPFLT